MNASTRTDSEGELPPEPSDEQILAAVRTGDIGDFALLWRRHVAAAHRAAKAIAPTTEPDDLVSEAFASILRVTKAGGGPRDVFRPYLFAVLRNTAVRWGRAARTVSIEVVAEADLAPDFVDPIERMAEQSSVAAVFTTLSTRHRTLLWYLEVEGMKPRELAPLMGITPNAVSALAHRARDSFRRAWLEAHIHDPSRSEECRWFCGHLVSRRGPSTRGGDATRFRAHLAECRGCRIVAAEIDDLTHRLRFILPAALLGGAAAGVYVGAPDTASAAGGAAGASAVGAAVTGSHAAASVAVPIGGVIALAAAAIVVTASVVLAGSVLGAPAAPPESDDAPVIHAQSPAPGDRLDSDAPPAATPITPPPAESSEQHHTERTDADELRHVPLDIESDRHVPNPAPAPAAPAPASTSTPAPQPTDSEPGTEESESAYDAQRRMVLQITRNIAQNSLVPALIEGIGLPGAIVVAFDETGATLAATAVGEDGTFSLDVSGARLHQGMTVSTAESGPEPGALRLAETVGPLRFAAPELSTTGPEQCAHSAAHGCTQVRVERGAWVEIVEADGDTHVLHAPPGGREGEPVVLEAPASCIAARYIDPLTGRTGVTVLVDGGSG